MRISRREIFALTALAATIMLLATATLTLGDLGIHPRQMRELITANADSTTVFVFQRLRGPRLVTALLVGLLFGIAGALFQSATRNPLGSPDVIGITAGAKAGMALFVLVPTMPTAVAAGLGAGAAAFIVYLATGNGFRSPTRTIIAGIAVGALAHALTHYVMTMKLRHGAHQLAAALTGSLNAASWHDALIAAAALAVVWPAALVLAPDLSLLALGDDTASGLGAGPNTTRTVAIVLSTIAAGAAVAASGPIAFIALTAPQIAARITATARVPITGAAAVGAVIALGADLLVQQASVVHGLPTGVITLGVGGIYLGFLLVRESRKGTL